MSGTPAISVVLPVCNVEDYLRDCLDSILRQTFADFELICIDDGSTDASGAILDEYAGRDPRISVVHQANAGVSAARNRGLSLARGEYLYFCDPDDLCKSRLLEKLLRRARKDRADVVCCERESFDCLSGRRMGRLAFPDWLWRIPMPFAGEDIADRLLATFGSSTVDKLISRRLVAAHAIRFDADVRRFALFYFTSMVLVRAKRISIIPDSLYLYRENRPGSLQSSREQSPMDAFRTRATFAAELRRSGLFEKYEIGYLVSLLRIARSQLRVLRLPQNRQAVYATLMTMVSEVMDRPGFPVMEFANLPEYRYWRELQNAKGPGTAPLSADLRTFDLTPPWRLACRERWRSWCAMSRRWVGCGVPGLRRLSDGWRLKLDFLALRGDSLCFEGTFICDRPDAVNVFNSLELVRESPSGGKLSVRPSDQANELAETPDYGRIAKAWRFTCAFPNPAGCDATVCYRWIVNGGGSPLAWHRVEHTRYSPFTNQLRFPYAILDGCLFTFRGDVLTARSATVWRRAGAELLLCLNLLKKRSMVAGKALVLRWFVRLVRGMRRRQWLFSDRFNVADDNGRAMYDYVSALPKSENPPATVLALSAASPQFHELAGRGRVVNADSFRYKLEFLLSECVLSAYHTRRHRLPFDDRFVEFAKDVVLRPKFIQLRHGVCQNDTSAMQNKWFDNPSVLLTVSARERESMLAPSYGFSPEVVSLTGFPRFDLLYDSPKKYITFMPTWRSDLIEWSPDGRHRQAADAAENPFIRNYQAVLSDTDFIDACERAGYTVCVKAHPNLAAVQHLLKMDARVRVWGNDIPYRQVFAESDLLITDYSSVAFDFAYLRKPVIYFQFDRKDFFKATYRPGYFDCARDGFGPVADDSDALRKRIAELTGSGCKLAPEYERRVRQFFAHLDQENRNRTYQAILRTCRRREA